MLYRIVKFYKVLIKPPLLISVYFDESSLIQRLYILGYILGYISAYDEIHNLSSIIKELSSKNFYDDNRSENRFLKSFFFFVKTHGFL